MSKMRGCPDAAAIEPTETDSIGGRFRAMLIAVGAGLIVAYGCIFALMRAGGNADVAVAEWAAEYRERAS